MRPAAAASPRSPPATESWELTRNSILRIADDKTIQLIQEWEGEECLWNTSLKDYPNRLERTRATDKIARILKIPNFTSRHVSIKFKNLRNSYCQELKRMALDKSYKPKVFWFSYMDRFLRPHLQKINSYNVDGHSSKEKNTPDYEIKTEIDSDDQTNAEDWTIENSIQDEASSSNFIRIETIYTEPASEIDESSNQSLPKKRKMGKEAAKKSKTNPNLFIEVVPMANNNEQKNKQDNTIKQIPDYEQEHQDDSSKTPWNFSIEKSSIKPRKQDYYDTFGAHVASLLRALPKKKALMLQPKIVGMIVAVTVEDDDDGSGSGGSC